jgi:NAD(P)-dependent dehydrogenase (short-subunit alcohol dehydrogenase family)
MQIKFQIAWITGSSRGLGRQIAVKLATGGASRKSRFITGRGGPMRKLQCDIAGITWRRSGRH